MILENRVQWGHQNVTYISNSFEWKCVWKKNVVESMWDNTGEEKECSVQDIWLTSPVTECKFKHEKMVSTFQ